MKALFNILLIFLFSPLCYSQEQRDTLKSNPSSSESIQNIQLRFDEFDMLRELNYMEKNLFLNNDPETSMLWTSYILSNRSGFDLQVGDETPGHITSILYEQYLEDSEFNAVKYILGAAQLSAAGYLAYLHIKKYGFLK